MSSTRSSNDRSPLLGVLLRISSQMMGARYLAWLKTTKYDDILPTHSAVIQPLWEHPGGARITKLARVSRMTKQSMSALVDQLEERGYVERTPDPDDARASLVNLTARGDAFARAVRAFARETEADCARRVGARRMEDLKTTLTMLRQSWLADD